ncbi:hypothetical protein D3C81_1537640 [compost metagenome]
MQQASGAVPCCAVGSWVVCGQGMLQMLLVFAAQPAGLLRRVVQVAEHHEAHDHRRHAFEQEQPLPAVQTPYTIQAKYQPRERRPEACGKRHRDHKQGVGPCPVSRRKPERQVQQHTWQKACLRDTHQNPQQVQAAGISREQRRGRGQPPGDHQAADPFACTNLGQGHVAGDTTGDIGDVEQRGGHAELGAAQA